MAPRSGPRWTGHVDGRHPDGSSRRSRFGAIYKHLLDDNPNNAITVAAILLACAAAAMMWIKEPRIVRDVDDVLAMPMGGGH